MRWTMNRTQPDRRTHVPLVAEYSVPERMATRPATEELKTMEEEPAALSSGCIS
jgi:hypothetical protein